ncbi:hypothetical protein RF11_14233 [Thelohanellus kitauei]|uniref:Uncharacterized protein n=1 Tax=Thelohanellus kitauei TaxID=669202 RepID=A0A0C2MGN3_THEKT|nr:hypothetical protein RF11_14233 [Thelohanellus kitauei]
MTKSGSIKHICAKHSFAKTSCFASAYSLEELRKLCEAGARLSNIRRGANFYEKKMLIYNKKPIELRNMARTPWVGYRRSQEESPLTLCDRGNEFIPSVSRGSTSSKACASNEEAKSVSPLRAVLIYVCHATTYP